MFFQATRGNKSERNETVKRVEEFVTCSCLGQCPLPLMLGFSSPSLLWWSLKQWAHLRWGWRMRSMAWCIVTFDPAWQVSKGEEKKQKKRKRKTLTHWLSTFHTVRFELFAQLLHLACAPCSQLQSTFVSPSSLSSCSKSLHEHYGCKSHLWRWGRSLRNEEQDSGWERPLGRDQQETSYPYCLPDCNSGSDLPLHAVWSHACEYGLSCFTACLAFDANLCCFPAKSKESF